MVKQGASMWYSTWCEPVVVALFRHDRTDIERQLQRAWDAIKKGLVTGADMECLSRQLIYNTIQAYFQWKDPGWEEAGIPKLLDELSRPCIGDEAEGLRRRLYIQTRTSLDRFGMLAFTPSEMHLEYENLPDTEKTNEFWQYVSKWAFKYEQGFYLEKAYEAAVLTGYGFTAQWGWRRIDVMWRIINKQATTMDILKLIDAAQLPGHVMWILTEVLPRAKKLGVHSDVIEARIHSRENELRNYTSENILAVLRPHMDKESSAAGRVVSC